MKNIFNEKNLNKFKNVLLAAFIFGGIGAYVGIQAMYAIDARQDDRINAVLHANSATKATVSQASPVPVATPGK